MKDYLFGMCNGIINSGIRTDNPALRYLCIVYTTLQLVDKLDVWEEFKKFYSTTMYAEEGKRLFRLVEYGY